MVLLTTDYVNGQNKPSTQQFPSIILNLPNSNNGTVQPNQQLNQNNYYQTPPTNQNNPTNVIEQQDRNRQVGREQINKEINGAYRQNKALNDEYWKVPGFSEYTKTFNDAFTIILDMLTGNKSLSVKDAYYEIEKANGNVYLTKAEYDEQINISVGFIQQWLYENHYNLKDNLSLNYGIQKFMTDTLTIKNKKNSEMPNIKMTHLGFYYDYQDYKAKKDERSYYVSKTFATGNGQCHTLPIVYLILAEQLGAKAYLSYAPIHSFIKYPDKKGNIHNFETTSNWQITDQWYMENFNIKPLAIEKGIYLNALGRQQLIASAMIDLACSYDKKFGIADGCFISKCLDTAMNYFSNKEANITAWLIREKIVNVKLNRIAKKNQKKTKEEIEKIPEVQVLLKELETIDTKIESLGYEPLPESTYDKMVQNQDNKGNIQQLKQFDNLKKRNLFITSN
ncbi:MAG: hypothetical protein ACOYOV_13295 [Bacteroidales bacterium]